MPNKTTFNDTKPYAVKVPSYEINMVVYTYKDVTDILIKNFLIVTYDYNNLGRLNNNVISTGSASFTINYSYEAGAYQNSITNRLSEIDNNGKINYAYDAIGIEDNIIVIRVYKETSYFEFLLDIDEEMNISKIEINELEQKICDIIFDIYRVSELDYAFCDNEAEIEYSPDEFRNLEEKIYSIVVLPVIKDKEVALKLIKSNWKIDGYSLRDDIII